jgi:hypothetical protein
MDGQSSSTNINPELYFNLPSCAILSLSSTKPKPPAMLNAIHPNLSERFEQTTLRLTPKKTTASGSTKTSVPREDTASLRREDTLPPRRTADEVD